MKTPARGEAPTMPDPVRVPNADDPDVAVLRKAKLAEEFKDRKGRSSTNLTGAADRVQTRTILG